MGDDDSKKYRPLRGGIQLESESYPSASGTLGCLAETNRPGEPKRIVVLSVAHLLYAGRDGNKLGPITDPGDRACQPNACSKCSRCCSDDVGRALRGEFSEEVDAAIATLYVGTKYLKEVHEIGPIKGAHEITDKEAHTRGQPFRVRKRGIRTKLTEGTVRLLDFATGTKGVDDGFKRRARRLVLIQPKTLFEGPVTAIQNETIRVDNAKFKSLGIDPKKHVIEISGPTRNRKLYRIHEIPSDTVIVPEHPLNPNFAAELTPEAQPDFRPIQRIIFTQEGQHGVLANGLAAINNGLLPFDMVEIRKTPSNDGIYQVQPLGLGAIVQDQVAVYEELPPQLPVGAEVRGVIFIRVREERFCDASDSGAVVVNDAAEVVGLLAGKVEDKNRPELGGYGFATPITLITQSLGIDILSAQQAGQEAVVAETEGEPDSGSVAASTAGRRAAIPLQRDQLLTLRGVQQDLLRTAGGKEYAELFRRHFEEVQTLINTNKRVAVVWQRNGGPLLAQVAFNAVQNPDIPIPADINGVQLEFCLNNILGSLQRYGSADLQTDIAQFGPSWTRFAGMSFNQVKSGLENPPDNLHV